MQKRREEITKEKFEELDKMDNKQFNNYIDSKIPIEWACGYGHYGAYLKEEDGKYYIIHNLGSSCD